MVIYATSKSKYKLKSCMYMVVCLSSLSIYENIIDDQNIAIMQTLKFYHILCNFICVLPAH